MESKAAALHAGADSVACEYLRLSLPGQQMKATPQRSESGTPFALLSSAATQLQNTCSASPARRPLARESTPATSCFTLPHPPASVSPLLLGSHQRTPQLGPVLLLGCDA